MVKTKCQREIIQVNRHISDCKKKSTKILLHIFRLKILCDLFKNSKILYRAPILKIIRNLKPMSKLILCEFCSLFSPMQTIIQLVCNKHKVYMLLILWDINNTFHKQQILYLLTQESHCNETVILRMKVQWTNKINLEKNLNIYVWWLVAR